MPRLIQGALVVFVIGWASAGAGPVICLASGISAASLTVDGEPAVGTGFHCLVRGRNACGAGSYGSASSGSERLTAACP